MVADCWPGNCPNRLKDYIPTKILLFHADSIVFFCFISLFCNSIDTSNNFGTN